MTKEQYYEMCEMLDSEPVDDEVPIDLDDFPSEVQIALRMHSLLRDTWEYTAGNYVGKDMTHVFKVFELFEIPREDYIQYYEFITTIDSIRTKMHAEIKAASKPPGS